MAVNSLVEAEKMLKQEKRFLLETLTKTSKDEFQNDRIFFPLYEEQAKYEIKKLRLSKEQKKHYINQIVEIYGPYSEDQPSNKSDAPYYSTFYTKK